MSRIKQLKQKLPVLLSYISLMYFIEIIYMMLVIVILYGKTASIITGLTLSVLLSYQIISVNLGKKSGRKVQIVIMEIHFAISIAFITNLIRLDLSIYRPDLIITTVRLMLTALELPLIFLLTGDDVVEIFSR